MTHFTEYNYIFGTCLMTMALVSTISSVLTLCIIHQLRKFSGYLVLVYSMTVCQIIYDLSFFFFSGYQIKTVYSVIQFLTCFGGISVAIWTNILSGVVLYISMYFKSVEIWAHYGGFLFISIVPAFAWAVATLVVADDTLMNTWYNYMRFVFILFNFIVYIIISINLHRLGQGLVYEPLRELSRRFKYYPICQILTRIPAVCYQFKYGYGTEDFDSPRSTSELISLIFYCVTIPSAGFAYFIVFLWMQPQALEILKGWLSHCCCCEYVKPVKSMDKLQPKDFDMNESQASQSSAAQDRFDKFCSNMDANEQLHIHLIGSSSNSNETPDRLSEVCYSPLTESAMQQYAYGYRDLDEDELCQSLVQQQYANNPHQYQHALHYLSSNNYSSDSGWNIKS